jgi:hypothetical protein
MAPNLPLSQIRHPLTDTMSQRGGQYASEITRRLCVTFLVMCGHHGCLPSQTSRPGTRAESATRAGPGTRAMRVLPQAPSPTRTSPVPGLRARTSRRTAPVLQRAGYNRPSVTSGRFKVRHPAHLMTVTGSFVRRFAVIRGLGAGGPVSDSRGCGRRYPWCIRMIVQVTQSLRVISCRALCDPVSHRCGSRALNRAGRWPLCTLCGK